MPRTKMETVSDKTRRLLKGYQKAELTDSAVYANMAKREKNPENKRILQQIAQEETEHAAIWKKYTNEDIPPNRLKVFINTFIGIVMGFTFIVKLMEKGEEQTASDYALLAKEIPEANRIIEQEQKHEDILIEMLDEERLNYVGAMVLGLNDALVELTGTIAGLTFAMANTQLVALSGIITGVSATLSMAASNYLAEHADGNPKAFKSSLYTGVAYLVTVVILVLPYLLFPSDMYVAALICMLAAVILIILFFNFYISIARSQPFVQNFARMAIISLSVAVISFGIGLLAKQLLGIDI
ncbi:VIT1/CCC1 transporter family protein [Eubacteriales bacterium OttesenSCG-928-N14]|nr:VIT1/CCC1 transporter family protein [Eubacteriales bacterium OttesenSCG-928-N14]